MLSCLNKQCVDDRKIKLSLLWFNLLQYIGTSSVFACIVFTATKVEATYLAMRLNYELAHREQEKVVRPPAGRGGHSY